MGHAPLETGGAIQSGVVSNLTVKGKSREKIVPSWLVDGFRFNIIDVHIKSKGISFFS